MAPYGHVSVCIVCSTYEILTVNGLYMKNVLYKGRRKRTYLHNLTFMIYDSNKSVFSLMNSIRIQVYSYLNAIDLSWYWEPCWGCWSAVVWSRDPQRMTGSPQQDQFQSLLPVAKPPSLPRFLHMHTTTASTKHF